MPVLAGLRAISYRSHRGCNNFVIRKHLSLATYFLQAAPQCLTIESDMQISGNCRKNTGYPELYPKIRKNKYTYNSSHLGLSVSLGFACSQNVDIRQLAPVQNFCLLYKYCFINLRSAIPSFIVSSIKSAIKSPGWIVCHTKAILATDFGEQCGFPGANKAEPPCVSLMYIYTLGNSLLFCHISFTPALVQMTLMMLKVRRMLLINVVQRPGMYVTFICQMTCVNSVQSIHPDRLLCFQGYEIRLENSRTREIDGIACLKLAIAAICLQGLTDLILGSITPKHEWMRMQLPAEVY